MSYKIVTNKPGTKVVMRVWANTELSLANLQSNATEVIVSAHITQISGHTEGTANVTYWRANTSDANNKILQIPTTAMYWDYAGTGMVPDSDKDTANIIFRTDSSNTMILVEFKKISNYSVQP
jgi:hypothetical protein